MCTVPVLSRVCRESYNESGALYQRLKQRGMDLVTVTDHDSIGAAEDLRHHADFFLSEEVTCTMPSGTEIHAGVYGMREADHMELQRRRDDLESLLAYVEERGLFLTINHLYSSLTGRREADDFERFARDFHGVEALNGCMLRRANRMAQEFAQRHNKPVTGGSDSHTLTGLARTFTEVRGARNAEEFLDGLRHGQSVAIGEHGNYWKLTSAVFGIGGSLIKARPWMLLAAALFAAAPVIIFGNYLLERAFIRKWGARATTTHPQVVSYPQRSVAARKPLRFADGG